MASASTGWSTEIDVDTSSSSTYVDITVHALWQNEGWNYDIGNVYAYVTCDGTEEEVLTNGHVTAPSNHSSYDLGSHTFRIYRTHSSQTINCRAKINSRSSYTGNQTKQSGTEQVDIDPLSSYTVSYNANGGSGAPGSQTKWYGETLKLSTTTPTRTGYSFAGWNTNSSGTGTNYSAGANYTGNSGMRLYAKWTPNTYTVSYNANGGSGAPSNQTKTYGTNLTLSSTRPTRTDYNFLGWSTSSGGSVQYQPGGTYSANAAVTLYAIWELAYVKPRINDFIANRCDSNGDIDESGEYLKTSFNWATDENVSQIKVEYKISSSSTWSVLSTLSASGKSGSINAVLGGQLDADTTYSIRAYVADSKGSSYSTEATLSTEFYPIDIKRKGKGIAFGKVSELDDYCEINYKPKFYKPLEGNTSRVIETNDEIDNINESTYTLASKKRKVNNNPYYMNIGLGESNDNDGCFTVEVFAADHSTGNDWVARMELKGSSGKLRNAKTKQLFMEASAITVGLNSDHTCANGDGSNLNLNKTLAYVGGGNRLTLSNGGVRIGKDISRVLVFGQVYWHTNVSGKRLNFRTLKNSDLIANMNTYCNTNYIHASIAPRITYVSEGDIIYMAATGDNNNEIIKAYNHGTFMTVMVLE